MIGGVESLVGVVGVGMPQLLVPRLGVLGGLVGVIGVLFGGSPPVLTIGGFIFIFAPLKTGYLERTFE